MTAAPADVAGPPDGDFTVRPVDGPCSQWLGARYCWEPVTTYWQNGHRCPVHTVNALAGRAEPLPGPGIPAYREAP